MSREESLVHEYIEPWEALTEWERQVEAQALLLGHGPLKRSHGHLPRVSTIQCTVCGTHSAIHPKVGIARYACGEQPHESLEELAAARKKMVQQKILNPDPLKILKGGQRGH